MKFFKKTGISLAAILLTILILPAAAHAAESFTVSFDAGGGSGEDE